MGRAGLDMYSGQDGVSLQEVTSFIPGVGGSPANIAVGLATLNSRVGIITKVCDDSIGDYVLHYLQKKRVDISHALKDKKLKTTLVITEIKPEGGKVVFYRENPADLNIAIEEIKRSYLRKTAAIVLTGTSLAKNPSRETMLKICQMNPKDEFKVIFDLDYRPFHWLNKRETKLYYEKVCEQSHFIIGNLEEFKVLLPSLTWEGVKQKSFAKYFKGKAEIIVLKNGPKGTKIFSKPDSSEIFIEPYEVEAKKPFGSGDAFLASFCHCLKQGGSLREAGEFASASAALVVLQRTCSEAMPSEEQVIKFIKKYKNREKNESH